jgi:hypothetical protein
MSTPKENWKPIPEFPGYEVHVNGLVRNIETQVTSRSFIKTEAPFLRVNLWAYGKIHEVPVLPLVQELFTQEERNNVGANR